MGKPDKMIVAEGAGGAAARIQCGALCWRMHGAGPEVLLITSRDTGRWVIPKGWPIEALSAAEAAAREAWEEAGVEGALDGGSLGFFAYRKGLGPSVSVPCVVEVFALRVDRLASGYPEKGQRRRKWFSLDKAAKRVDEPELRRLILDFEPPGGTTGKRQTTRR
ncbi:MAG: NUDIX hydrolase [Paracoccaceae bacterium]